MKILWVKRDGLWWFSRVGSANELYLFARVKYAGMQTMITSTWGGE